MKAAYAVFTLILVLFPLGILTPMINRDKTDLNDFNPRNFGLPRKGMNTFTNPRDPQGRSGLELLQASGDLTYGSDSGELTGTVTPGDDITIRGRIGGWNPNDFTLAEVTVYIFWNTEITTPSSWVNSPWQNGITIVNSSTYIASPVTNGTAKPNSGGIPENYDFTEAGFFETTFTLPDFGNAEGHNVQVGNNSIVAYFLGNEKQPYYWEAGHTTVEVVGTVELGETAADASVDPESSVTFTYRATLTGTSTPLSNASIEFNWIGPAPFGTTISAPGFASSGGNVYRTDSNGYVTFQIDTEIETPPGTYSLNATIVALDPDDDILYDISTTNYNHSPSLTVNNLFVDAIVTISATPQNIRAGYSTIVKVETRFQGNGSAIVGVPVNITVVPSPSVILNKLTYPLINNGNPAAGGYWGPGWYITNATGEIAWNFTTTYDDFGDYTAEGNVQVTAIADYGHWAYDKGTQLIDYRRFYFTNGTNNPDWANSYDNSTATTLFNIDNQWEFGTVVVQEIDQDDKIEVGDNWRHLRADSITRENLSLVLRVYNLNTTSSLANVNVTFWLNASTGLELYFWNVSAGGWQDITSAITSGTTAETDMNGELAIRINVTATATKYMKVVLHAYANFTQFPRFAYLNGTKAVGTQRISNLTHSLGTPNPWDRGFQINPRYRTGGISLAPLAQRYSDNDTYAVGYSGISTTDGTIRRGNWVTIKYQVLNSSQALANAPINFTLPENPTGVMLHVEPAYDEANLQYPGQFPMNEWYLTDSSGYIEVNITTDKSTSPKSLQNVNVTANVSFTVFPYINVSLTEQYTSINGTFTFDPQYVYGIVTATDPTPRKVPSGGPNITLTFEVKDPAGNLVPGVRIHNYTTTNSTGIFAMFYWNGTDWDNVNHTEHNYTITFAGATFTGSYWELDKGNITFTIDPTTNSTPVEIPTPEGDYRLEIMVNFTDAYDNLPYLNGTGIGNNETAISSTFTIQEEKTLSISITGTNPPLGTANGFYKVKRGVTTISLEGSYVSSTGQPLPGPVRIGWNATPRLSHTSDIWGVTDIPVLGDGSFTTSITITTASNMPVGNITIFADNSTVLNKELGEENNINAEAITYVKIIIVSDLVFGSGPTSDRGMVFVGQTCTISGTLVDDQGDSLNDTLAPASVHIRGWAPIASAFVPGIDLYPVLTTGPFSDANFEIPDDYSEDTIEVLVEVSGTLHYLATSDQSVVINVYSDVAQGSTSGGANAQLAYTNSSGYSGYDSQYATDSGTVTNDGEVEVYNGTVTIQGWIFDQAGRLLTSAYANYANNVSAFLYWNATHQWWQNTTTDATGRFTLSFNNTGPTTWDLVSNGSWTIRIYFVTENGTAISLQNITIFYYMIDFTRPVAKTTMVKDTTPVSEGGVVYGTAILYINATDPGPSDGSVYTGIAEDALTYRIDSGSWIPVTTKSDAENWTITINADSAIYDASDNHTVHINITDNNGNVLYYTWIFLVDNTPPNITANQNDSILLVRTATLSFNLEENTAVAGYTTLDNSTIVFDIDSSGSPQSGTNNFTDPTLTLTINTTNLSGENHIIQVWVSDVAGNQGTLIFNFTVDGTAPLIEDWGDLTAGGKLYVDGLYTISISLIDPLLSSGDNGSGIDDSSFLVYVDNNPSNNLSTPIFDPSTEVYETTWDTAGYAVGPHTLTVIVSDIQGNQGNISLSLNFIRITSPEAQGTIPNLNWSGYLGSASAEAVNIRVEDPSASGTVTVTITSQLGSIDLTLSETASGSGIFTNQLFFSLRSSNQVAQQLQVANGGIVIISHSDIGNTTGAFVVTWYGGITGSVEIDQTTYESGDIAKITVTDNDSNGDLNSIDTIIVYVGSNSSSEISIILEETSEGSGIFTGRVKLVTGDSSETADPRRVKIRDGDIITFRYRDSTDEYGDTTNIIKMARASVEDTGGGVDIVTTVILLAVLSPLALGGGIGSAILFERLREYYSSR